MIASGLFYCSCVILPSVATLALEADDRQRQRVPEFGGAALVGETLGRRSEALNIAVKRSRVRRHPVRRFAHQIDIGRYLSLYWLHNVRRLLFDPEAAASMSRSRSSVAGSGSGGFRLKGPKFIAASSKKLAAERYTTKNHGTAGIS